MSAQESGKRIPSDGQVAVELQLAVRAGDVAAIRRLLHDDPTLASARLVGKDGGAGRAVQTNLLIDQPIRSSIHLLTAGVANTIVATCSSIPRNPSRQLGCAGFHASSRLAAGFDAPRMSVIILQLA
jgi:hypothetical protein